MAQRHMNVEIGAEAALFPEKEDINGIAVAVHDGKAWTHKTIPAVEQTQTMKPNHGQAKW